MRSTADIEGLRSVFCAIDHVASEINICSVIMYCIQANTRRSRPNSFIVLCWPQQLNSLQYDDQGLLLSRGLIQDVSTRWNRTFYMLERLSLLRWSVVAVLYDQSLTKPQEARVLEMHAESCKLAEKIVLVLRKVELATVLFSSQSKTTSGVVLPAITGLVQQLKAMTFERANDGQRRASEQPLRQARTLGILSSSRWLTDSSSTNWMLPVKKQLPAKRFHFIFWPGSVICHF